MSTGMIPKNAVSVSLTTAKGTRIVKGDKLKALTDLDIQTAERVVVLDTEGRQRVTKDREGPTGWIA